MRDVDNVGNLFEVNVVIGFYECDALDADGENVDQALVQVTPCDRLVVNLDIRMIGSLPILHLDDNGAVGRVYGTVFRIGLLWDLRVETFWFFLN